MRGARLVLPLVAAAALAAGLGRAETRGQPRELDFRQVQMVAAGLEVPWALAFPAEGTILVTERPGRVRAIVRGKLRGRPAAQLNIAAFGEGGLLGLALDPEFPRRRFAYVYYTASDGNRVSRFAVGRDLRFRAEKILVRGIPASGRHDGGQIAFGPDGFLYVTTGDAGDPANGADRSSLGGKILRVTRDGRVPVGNPFPGSPVYSYGHRNPQGLAWDGEGRLFAPEHGPTGEGGLCCHDELNRIVAGGFYGWPFLAGRVRVFGGRPPARPRPPLVESGSDTWAPAGAAIRGRTLFVATLAGESLLRFELRGGGVTGPRTVLRGFGRLRAAAFGPDGCLHLTTSNRDGRGSPAASDDRVLRVC